MEGFSAINGIAQDYFRSSCDILVGGYSSYIRNDCNSFVLGQKYQPFALSNSVGHAYDHFETQPIKLYIRRKVIKCRYSLCTFWSHIQGCTKIIQGVTKQNSSKNMLTLLDHPVLMEHFHHFVIKELNSTKYKLSENVLVLIVYWFCNAYSGCAKIVFFFHHNSCKCQSSHTYLYILCEKFGEKITLKCPVLKFYKYRYTIIYCNIMIWLYRVFKVCVNSNPDAQVTYRIHQS